MERGEPAELARHVVRLRRNGPERRPADDELGAAEPHEIGEVGVAAGKLRDLHVGRQVEPFDVKFGKVAPEIRRERGPIELLGRPDLSRVSVHGLLDYHARHAVRDVGQGETARERLTAFMDEHIYPNEATFRARSTAGDRWQPDRSSRS